MKKCPETLTQVGAETYTTNWETGQVQGIDFFETYCPEVQWKWMTIRLMLILECFLGLCSKQGDINCDFLHTKLGDHEAGFIEMPQGFKQNYNKHGEP